MINYEGWPCSVCCDGSIVYLEVGWTMLSQTGALLFTSAPVIKLSPSEDLLE